MSETDAKRASSGFSRRQVMVGGAALAALPVLERAARAQRVADGALAIGAAASRRAARATVGPISIGFLDGSELLSDLRLVQADLRLGGAALGAAALGAGLGAGYAVVPASALASGDPLLDERPLRLRVAGLYPAVPIGGGPRKVDLEIEQPIADLPGRQAPFYAWSYRRQPLDVSAPVAFTATTSQSTPLALVLRLTSANGKASVLRSALTLGSDAGRPRLQRGVYLLALVGRPWDVDATLPGDPAVASGAMFSLVLTVDPLTV